MIISIFSAYLCLVLVNVEATPSFDGPVEISELFGSPDVRVDEVYDDEPAGPEQPNCSYFANDGYRCVPYDTCIDGEILTSGAGLIDVRNGFLEPDLSHCPSYLEVCCRLSTHFGDPLKLKPKPPARRSVFTYVEGHSFIEIKYDASEIRVRCGEWDTQQTIEPLPHEDRDVRYSSIHPAFNNASLHNDFALLHLEKPFELAPHIDVMCLPTEGRSGYTKAGCIATGWGKDQFGIQGKYQVVPKQIILDLVSNGDCEDTLRSTRLGQSFILDKSFICAGGQEGQDTCKGDGGGPLVCPMDDGSYVQTGIVAWGIDCGKNGIPGVYANVKDGLCFMDYALRCQEGREVAQEIGIRGCRGWMREQNKLLTSQRSKYQALVLATEGRSKASHNRKLQDTKQLINKFRRFKMECKLNRREETETDVDEVGEPVDVSQFVRIGGGGFEAQTESPIENEDPIETTTLSASTEEMGMVEE
eukprot:TCALIF_08948-PA protein Name:"Similar to Sb Serine proteinase stubble (Drosophila melanogaster)" AED:0.32 eAED:0.35 QI:0/0.25/0.4/1/0.5/0.8/5/32/472